MKSAISSRSVPVYAARGSGFAQGNADRLVTCRDLRDLWKNYRQGLIASFGTRVIRKFVSLGDYNQGTEI